VQCKKHLSGWASHISCIFKKEKLHLSSIIDDLAALVSTVEVGTQGGNPGFSGGGAPP
jgi:hypothetical protein